jgi:hypothetical protein
VLVSDTPLIKSFGASELLYSFAKLCLPQVGRERLSAICLMQKFVHLKGLDTKLQLISAFAVDHVKGFIYVEAERQNDINQVALVIGF